ncbi:cytochrome P450 [Kitasatospora sp. NPDC056181]|uniref:cytochrome P450 n=1 Tax=Kitasatospora sp. NPDC056181 TaxID=3345737 RepID=UPI0035D80053
MLAQHTGRPGGADRHALLLADPLSTLLAARRQDGDVAVLTDGVPVFSRGLGTAGCVAAFGAANVREVLLGAETFGRPATMAERDGLPPVVGALSSGLFSMGGAVHRQRRRAFGPLFTRRLAERCAGLVADETAALAGSWRPGEVVGLAEEMNRLSHALMGGLLFGDAAGDRGLGDGCHHLLALRRRYAATGLPDGRVRSALHTELATAGGDLQAALRARIGHHRAPGSPSGKGGCLLAGLSRARDEAGQLLPEGELAAHASAFFLAGSEPLAAALVWTVLLLTQFADIHGELCRLLRSGEGASGRGRELLEAVVRESLRVLPPNAVMVRVTTRETLLGGHRLPARCELLVSPFVAHREFAGDAPAAVFDPGRWRSARPSAFDYLPFGGGDRYCLGRHLAMTALTAALAGILRRWDLSLAGDQEIDWRLRAALVPAAEVRLLVREPGHGPVRGGRADGPLRELVRLP